MSFIDLLYASQLGEIKTSFFRQAIEYSRISNLTLSEKGVDISHEGSISYIDLENNEFRYLLATGTGRKVAIYDTWHLGRKSNSVFHKVSSVGEKESHKRFMHKKTINCVTWYPHDTGMFLTSSFDGTLKIWDSNTLKPAETLNLECPVYNHHMSSSSSNLLVACAATNYIRLADIRTGSTAHTLTGHRSNVLCVRWSPKEKYVLASGSQDGKVILWDVRRSKAQLCSLNQDTGLKVSSKHTAHSLAHSGSVNCLRFNNDGRYLLSYGTDDRLRLWDLTSSENSLINFGKVENNSKLLPIHAAIYDNGVSSSFAFIPSTRFIHVYDLYGGALIKRLNGHFSNIRCCAFNPVSQELYSTAQTSFIFVWSPKLTNEFATCYSTQSICNKREIHQSSSSTSDNNISTLESLTQDTWSDSD